MRDQQIEYEFEYPDVAQFPCPTLEFDIGMNCCQITHISALCEFGHRFCFGVLRKHRGRNTCPKNDTPRRFPQKVSKPKTNERSKRKRPKWKKMKPTTTRNLGKRSGGVVAEAKSKKTRSRKLAEGLCVKCVSWKLALWSRKHCGSCEYCNYFLSTRKQKNKIQMVLHGPPRKGAFASETSSVSRNHKNQELRNIASSTSPAACWAVAGSVPTWPAKSIGALRCTRQLADAVMM